MDLSPKVVHKPWGRRPNADPSPSIRRRRRLQQRKSKKVPGTNNSLLLFALNYTTPTAIHSNAEAARALRGVDVEVVDLIEDTDSTNVRPANTNTFDTNLDGQERQLSEELGGGDSEEDEPEDRPLRAPEATATGCAVTLQNDLANKHATSRGSEEKGGGLREGLPVAHLVTMQVLPTTRRSLTPLQHDNATFNTSTLHRPLRIEDNATSNEKNKKPGGGGKTLEDNIRGGKERT